MILKASQRGGGKQLALHLLKTEDNEHVELHEIRGFVSNDVVGAFKEAYAVSRGTKCKQFLFSVSLNPPEIESVGVDVFENAADRIEEKTGLTGQPRVIIFHEKEGRRHAHAVWSRIDADSMTAVNLSHFKLKLRDISKELYLENDWKIPRGLMDSKARDPRNFDLAEWQQSKRMGIHARDLKQEMQECWAISDSRAAFEHAVSERGMILAKGDRRGHVAVTHEGEVLSIARFTAKKAKEVRAKLGEPDTLPSVDDAKAQMARDMTRAFNRHIAEGRDQTDQKKAEFEEHRLTMAEEHTAERNKLDTAQKDRWVQETRERQERFNKGMRGLWDRLTGERARIQKQNEQEAYAAFRRDREQRDAIVAAQLCERQELQQQIREARQQQAGLLIELRQERQAYREKLPEPVPKPPDKQQPAPEPEEPVERQPPPVRDHHTRLEELRSTPAPAIQPTEAFRQAAQPSTSPQERLDNLRNSQSGPQPDKSPEPDRQ